MCQKILTCSYFIHDTAVTCGLYTSVLVSVTNRFCDEWIQAFVNAAERFNPFLLRQILENFKLKVCVCARSAL